MMNERRWQVEIEYANESGGGGVRMFSGVRAPSSGKAIDKAIDWLENDGFDVNMISSADAEELPSAYTHERGTK
jgi:hypothetical protein